MSHIGFCSAAMVQFWTTSTDDKCPSTRFEELAMPLFDSLYNLAHWLGATRAMPRISSRKLTERLCQFRFVSDRHQFPGMDVSNPEEHLPEFVLKT